MPHTSLTDLAVDSLALYGAEEGMDYPTLKATVFPVLSYLVEERGYQGMRVVDLTIAAVELAKVFGGTPLSHARALGRA